MEKVYSRTKTIQEDKVSGFCPGCMHGTVMKLIGEVLDVMKNLAQTGMTMIVVTHEMRFARNVSGRTIFLAGGKIEEDKSSHELFDNPESPRLISFLEKVL